MRITSVITGTMLVVVAGACAEQGQDPLALEPQFAVAGGGRLAVYNGGTANPAFARPCLTDQRYRQFDFWLGRWDAGGLNAPAPNTTSQIRNILDGCVIAENWSGGTGRSINAFDPDNGEWHQTWVTRFHQGHLRLHGNLQGTDMVMTGSRVQPNGVEWLDDYRWTPSGETHVVQAFSLVVRLGSTISFQTNGAVRYTRPVTLEVGPPRPGTGQCTATGLSFQSRELDFWLGKWTVSDGNGTILGTARITNELEGCLIEENYHTTVGYGAIGFAYFDFVEKKWYRTYIDSEGERTEVSGNLSGNAMVMTGMEQGKDGPLHVRATIEPVDANTVRQVWEISRDGMNWVTDVSLIFTRK